LSGHRVKGKTEGKELVAVHLENKWAVWEKIQQIPKVRRKEPKIITKKNVVHITRNQICYNATTKN
jgi:hypothetical protein